MNYWQKSTRGKGKQSGLIQEEKNVDERRRRGINKEEEEDG